MEPYIILAKGIIYCELVAIVFFLIRLTQGGRKNRRERMRALVPPHRTDALWLLLLIIVSFFSGEAMRLITQGAHPHDTFFYVHVSISAGALLAVILLNTPLFNGEKSRFHKFVAYPALVLCVGMVVTGGILTYRVHM